MSAVTTSKYASLPKVTLKIPLAYQSGVADPLPKKHGSSYIYTRVAQESWGTVLGVCGVWFVYILINSSLVPTAAFQWNKADHQTPSPALFG